MQLGGRVNLRSFNRAPLDLRDCSFRLISISRDGRRGYAGINHLASFVQLKCKSRCFLGVHARVSRIYTLHARGVGRVVRRHGLIDDSRCVRVEIFLSSFLPLLSFPFFFEEQIDFLPLLDLIGRPPIFTGASCCPAATCY